MSWEVLISDVKDYSRRSSDACWIVISGAQLFKIWKVCFFLLKLMAFLNRADCIFMLL